MSTATRAPREWRVYVSARGNAFMTELAELIAAAAAELDHETEVVQEGLPGERRDGAVELVVAPHEYFVLLPDRTDAQKQAAAAVCIPVATEQPGTPWFETSYTYCRAAPLVLDINPVGVAALAARGIQVRHLPLGYHESWDVWHGDDAYGRPIDLLFMGALTPRRESFLAVNAPLFASFDCRFLLTDPSRPLVESRPNFVIGREKLELLARSKVILNVHQGGAGYFEWHRVLPAFANGCAVVSEPSEDYSPLRRADHFVEAPLDLLGPYAAALVRDPERRTRLAREAYSFVSSDVVMARSLQQVRPDVVRAATAGAARAGRRLRPPRFPRRSGGVPLAAARAGSRRVEQWVKQRGRAALAHTPLPTLEASSLTALATMKSLTLNQVALRRRLDALESQVAGHDPNRFELIKSLAFDAVRPDITVGIPIYNYENHVDECLESVLASRGVLPELIVVDDRSTDRSNARVRAFMERHAHYPIALVERRSNRGLSAARNTIFELARSDYVFLLDADNSIYPDALRKLHAALSTSDAAFAYSILERFGEQPELYGQTPGLASAFPWDVERLVYGNYIDAMSLVRKSAWAETGGFNSELDERFGGWEDYAFWLDLAERGFEGLLVPEILARYRSHRGSMLSTVNLDLDSIFRFLRARHSTLPWPAS